MTAIVLGRHNNTEDAVSLHSNLTSSSDLIQLRKIAQDRIVNEMISQIKPNCTLSPDFVVLVLDKYTTHLFTRLNLSFYELYSHNVFQVEDLKKHRKRYPMTDVIYFVQPSFDSVETIINDFPEQDKFDYD
jgi:hypothetical protein